MVKRVDLLQGDKSKLCFYIFLFGSILLIILLFFSWKRIDNYLDYLGIISSISFVSIMFLFSSERGYFYYDDEKISSPAYYVFIEEHKEPKFYFYKDLKCYDYTNNKELLLLSENFDYEYYVKLSLDDFQNIENLLKKYDVKKHPNFFYKYRDKITKTS